MNILNEIERLIKIYGKEVSDKLYKNEFELLESDDYMAIVQVDNNYFSIWMANQDENTDFYDQIGNYNDILTKLLCKYFNIPDDMKTQIRVNIKNKQKEIDMDKGLYRGIEKTQLSNDLFFRFKGVYNEVKFTGYNDNDWWTKYKPLEVKEDENIIWQIDYEKMTAKYKPITNSKSK